MTFHLSETEIADIVQNGQQLKGEKKSHVMQCDQCRQNIKIQRMMVEELKFLKAQHAAANLDERVLERLQKSRGPIRYLKNSVTKIIWGFLSIIYLAIGIDIYAYNPVFKQLRNNTMDWQEIFISSMHNLVRYLANNTFMRELWLGIVFILFFLLIDLLIHHRRRSRFL